MSIEKALSRMGNDIRLTRVENDLARSKVGYIAKRLAAIGARGNDPYSTEPWLIQREINAIHAEVRILEWLAGFLK